MSCQRCRAPLKLDHSLDNLNPAAFDLLVGSSKVPPEGENVATRLPYAADRTDAYEAATQNGASPIFKKTSSTPRRGIPAAPTSTSTRGSAKDNPAMSFVMLTESQVRPLNLNVTSPSPTLKKQHSQPQSSSVENDSQQALSYKIDANTRLFEILSSRSDIDHPICNECTELLLSQFNSRLLASTKERDAYITFLKELRNSAPTEAEVNKARNDLKTAKAAEDEAFAELLALEKEKAKLEEQIADLDTESRKLELGEQTFWRSKNAFDVKLSSFADTRDALNASYDHDAELLERLQRTNVYNDTFCIGHDGNFGTINGLRLGRLSPPNNVEWAEINAAWGATALLLATVAEKLGFSFRGYIMRPMGSTTRIDKIDYSQTGSAASSTISTRTTSRNSQTQPRVTTLELFSSGDLPLGKMILHRRFNEAMVAFLECLNQLGEHVEKSGARNRQGEVLRLPYAIEKDKIQGVSIKLGMSQDEAWTSSCKYVLTCCKFLLAHASNVAASGR
ncbi:autophagy protein 6 [Thelotrema lepadinum]|nr:autophagy protein 6 [Thelotrema lepadinum]